MANDGPTSKTKEDRLHATPTLNPYTKTTQIGLFCQYHVWFSRQIISFADNIFHDCGLPGAGHARGFSFSLTRADRIEGGCLSARPAASMPHYKVCAIVECGAQARCGAQQAASARRKSPRLLS